jgi:D-glycero-D-manno-heptose 1,7-bisphosphate phosphatase
VSGRPFVVLDRDGTLIVEAHYLSDPDRVEILDGVPEALRELAEHGWGLVVVTNQSAIGRGFFDEARLEQIHTRLRDLLHDRGVSIDAIYHCPHTPDDGCECRKPEPGMVLRAARELDMDLASCVVVGDNVCDIELGQRLGLPTILVRTGYGSRVEGEVRPDFVADDLRAAAGIIRATRERSGTDANEPG